MSFEVTVTPQVTNVEVDATIQPFEVQITANDDLVQYVDDARQYAEDAEDSADSASASASSASSSASTATTQAGIATTQAGVATSQAGVATAQAGIATTKANEANQSALDALASEQASALSEQNASQSASNALASELASAQSAQDALASEQASALSEANALASEQSASASAQTATTQAGIATTQAGIATTQATNALASANAAAASAASAAQVGTSTLLTGFSVGSNTTIAGTDTILQAFNKTQGQINARVSGTIALISTGTGQIPYATANGVVSGSNLFLYNFNTGSLGIGVNPPLGKIDLIQTNDTTTGGLIIRSVNATATALSRLNSGFFILRNAGVDRHVLDNGSGQMWINTLSGTQTLDVNGTGRIRNGVSLADTSGNVLIGTITDSGDKLRVNGTVRLDSVTNATGDFVTIDTNNVLRKRTTAETLTDIGAFPSASLSIASGQVAFGSGTDTIAGSNNLFWDNANGRLGIGTSSPAQTLHVAGNIRVGNSANTIFSNRFFTLSSGDLLIQTTAGNGNILLTPIGSGNLQISSNTLIGTTTDSGFRLDVNGTARVTGNLTTNLTAGRVPFIGTGGVLSDSTGLLWDATLGALIATNRLSSSNGTNEFDTSSTNVSIYRSLNTGASEPFTLAGNLVLQSRPNNSMGIYFATGATPSWKWSIGGTGILQSNGATTIRTSTGDLTIATNGGNGNIALLPNGTGGVGVGTSSPNAVAQLEVSSTTKGFLPPRMTTAQRDLIAAVAGLVIYNTSTNKHQGHNGTAWQDFY